MSGQRGAEGQFSGCEPGWGVKLLLDWGGGVRLCYTSQGKARGARGEVGEALRLGLSPPPGRAKGRGLPYFKRPLVVRSAEAWGSRAARRPRRGGRVQPAAAALGREAQRRGGRTGGVTSQGAPHWNLIFIYPGFTLLLFFFSNFKIHILSRFNLFFASRSPLKSGRPFGEIAPLLPQITSDFGNQQREERGSKSSREKSRKRERDGVRERARASEQRQGQEQSE